MAAFNTRIVRRSNALQGLAYGRGLRYAEVMGTGRGPLGAAAAVGVTAGLFAFLDARWPSRRPAPCSTASCPRPAPGRPRPPASAGGSGWRSTPGPRAARRYHAEVRGRGDPGYAATAVMLGQSGLALALDGERLPDRAGSLTPATALGTVLVDRLRVAGHIYEVAPV